MYYTVGEIAKEIGLSPHTLRFYSKEGLLPFVDRSESGVRMFKDSDFEWLFLIECLKKTGMPIKDIKAFIDLGMQGDGTIGQRLELFRRQKQRVEEQIAELQAQLDVIKYKCWYYETAKNAGTCAVHETIAEEEIPQEIRYIREKSRRMHRLDGTNGPARAIKIPKASEPSGAAGC